MATEQVSLKSSQFVDAFPAAIQIRMPDNTTATFCRLDLDDLTEWCTKMHEEWKASGMKLLQPGMKPTERFQALRIIEFSKPSLDDIADATFRSEGIKEALRRSLMKGGMPEAKALAVIKMVPPGTARKLAQQVVTLFDSRVPPTPDLPESDSKPPLAPETGAIPDRPVQVPGELPQGQQLTGSNVNLPLYEAVSEANTGG